MSPIWVKILGEIMSEDKNNFILCGKQPEVNHRTGNLTQFPEFGRYS